MDMNFVQTSYAQKLQTTVHWQHFGPYTLV